MHDQTGLTPQPARRPNRFAPLARLFRGGRPAMPRRAATTAAAVSTFAEPLEGRMMFDVAAPVQLTVDANVNATKLLENQHSPAVAINPTNPAQVFIASTFDSRGTGALDDRDFDFNQETDPVIEGFSTVGIVGSVSNDSGKTFTSSGLFPGGVTPSAAYDQFGNLFVAYYVPDAPNALFGTAFDQTGTVHIALSTDNGTTFTELRSYDTELFFNDPFFFTNADPDTINDVLLTPEPTVVTGGGTVWVAFATNPTTFVIPPNGDLSGISFDQQIVAAGAPVQGLGAVGTFTDTETAQRSAGGQFPDIAVGPKGQIMVSYEVPRLDPDLATQNPVLGDQFLLTTITGPSDVFVNVDPDGLGPIPFGKRSKVTETRIGLSEPPPGQTDRVFNSESGIVYDRSGGPFNGRAWMVYTDERQVRGSNDTEILLRFSDDDGQTWSAARRVSTDPSSRNSQFLPRISIDQTTGNIAVSWYDARQSADVAFGPNDEIRYFAVVGRPTTAEGGVAFTDNTALSGGITDPSRSRSLVSLGYYSGLDFNNNVLYGSWADNSNSTNDNPSGGVLTSDALATLDIYSARVIVTPQPLSTPADTPVGPGSPLAPKFLGKDTINKGKAYKFQVRYTSPNGIDVSTLGDDDILVTGPNGYNLFADFTKAKASKGGSVTATYIAQAPGGLFDQGDNGLYSIIIQGGAVKDLAGTATATGLLDQFLVSSTLPPQSPAVHAAAAVKVAEDQDNLSAVGL
jgi:hypothetical protein